MDKKIGCVVLNYNDADTTIRQVERIAGYHCFSNIVVVDNHSSDDSWRRLQQLRSWRVRLLRAHENKGYGAGNNMGLQYCRDELKLQYAVIANPDTIFRESCVEGLYKVFEKNDQVGAAAGLMHPIDPGDSTVAQVPSCWPLQPWILDLLETGPVCRRLMKHTLTYPVSYGRGYRVVPVGAVHGSMLMVDLQKMKQCGDYDEGLFLYCEEKTLGARMKKHGYRTVLVKDVSYLHAHSSSISRTHRTLMSRQKLLHTSKLYYYRNYLNINQAQEFATRIFFSIILLELWLLGMVHHIDRNNAKTGLMQK